MTMRQRMVFVAIAAGWSPCEIAERLHCHPRTIRRIRQQIREQCPWAPDTA
ncbi:MAG: hypothetical protein C7B45_17700 [Sulfobacillus acidophilus]|uniref:Transposase IS30-like HTH domain-containing protein n=1 Tax=Sulfobacillus acidophilus TaxID=53633 RepID=A0A2T2WCD2_9FIRM|nr:MAG: hypothetical protein C7B45_17700 [Sulfobacillus acidophilus]